MAAGEASISAWSVWFVSASASRARCSARKRKTRSMVDAHCCAMARRVSRSWAGNVRGGGKPRETTPSGPPDEVIGTNAHASCPISSVIGRPG